MSEERDRSRLFPLRGSQEGRLRGSEGSRDGAAAGASGGAEWKSVKHVSAARSLSLWPVLISSIRGR